MGRCPRWPVMAATSEGRALTEQHRRAQVAAQRGFLAEFVALWLLLDPYRLDDTAPGWVSAVMRLIGVWRQQSADVAVDYYQRLRVVEAPRAPLPGPLPVFDRPAPADRVVRRVARGNRGSVVLRRDPGRQVTPVVSWRDADRAARASLIVTGPVNIKRRTGRGEGPQVAVRRALTESSGAASRHVLNGGRRALLVMADADPAALKWARVTDNDPCAFCAMLASRGFAYDTRASAAFEPHDGCACTVEPMFDRAAAWPGRAREFQAMWREFTRGTTGKAAVRAFRRGYERAQRAVDRDTAAA